jgi:hypothetical protein
MKEIIKKLKRIRLFNKLIIFYKNYGIKAFFLLPINLFIKTVLFVKKGKLQKKIIKFVKKHFKFLFLKFKKVKFVYSFTDNSNRVRNYIKNNIPIEDFFAFLLENKINYVVLRWFEELPYIAPNEDLDILMDDNDIKKIKGLLTSVPNNKKIDLYSVTALYSNKGLSYYPIRLAKEILYNKVLYKEKYFVPSPEHHFLSLSYHAIYHKGERSGLTSDSVTLGDYTPEHNYKEILANMARELSIDTEINLDKLHEYLTSKNWNPSVDTLRKLSKKSGSIWQKSIIYTPPPPPPYTQNIYLQKQGN